jgi:hypothetical protein
LEVRILPGIFFKCLADSGKAIGSEAGGTPEIKPIDEIL